MSDRSKQYTIKITETAWNMLIEHARFLANVNLEAANRLIDTFSEKADDLATAPERNPWLENEAIPFRKYRKLLFEKRYMALYVVQGDTVYIAAVVDCRQDCAWLL